MRATLLAFSCALLSWVLAACAGPKLPATLYSGGDILTLAGDSAEYVEALVEVEGNIAFVGALAEAERRFPSARRVPLSGHTLVPGFIDGHAHFQGFGTQAAGANLLASPDGQVNTIAELQAELKRWQREVGTGRSGGWVYGMGFDDAVLQERRFPTRHDLDAVSTEVPIIVIHISGHFCVLNSAGLARMNITATTPDPAGGIIRRERGSRQPNGVLEELAALPVIVQTIFPTDSATVDFILDKAQQTAVSFGYTTAHDGRVTQSHEQLASYATRGKLKIDVVSYVDYQFMPYLHSKWASREYDQHYRIGGLKLTLDGSPQGRTAWRTVPYLMAPDGQPHGYRGYPAIPKDAEVEALIDSAFRNRWQLIVHCNGDAALDQLAHCMKPAIASYGNTDRRTTLIHGQLIRRDQIDTLKKLDMIASFFPMHTFYWGDWYDQILGPKLADQISPMQSAIRQGVRVTSHTDAPVALPNLTRLMWTAVNRKSRSGRIIGADERLSPFQALQSITIWSAYQHFEEDRKGSLEVGKLADLVILNQNPLKVNPEAIDQVQVLATIKEGQRVFERAADH
jgi:predicted amidohydrolase YtcJ